MHDVSGIRAAGTLQERIPRIAAALGEIPPMGADAFIAAGFAIVGSVMKSEDGYACLNVREKEDPGDPLFGYRMMNVWLFGPRVAAKTAITEHVMEHQDEIPLDPFVCRIASEGGKNRTYHEPDPRTVPERTHTTEAAVWTDQGLVDDIKLLHSITPDVELLLGFHRLKGEPTYTREDEEALAAMNDVLGTFARRVAFLYGFGPPMQPLAPKERDVLVLLLGAEQQKAFDEALNVKASRVNELVQSVHAKMGSANRAELQRRWMSNRTEELKTLPVFARTRRRNAGPLAPK